MTWCQFWTRQCENHSYIFIRVSLMWADSWGHSDSSLKGSLWSVTGNSPTPSSVYIQQSDPMLQNRARRHHNGSCGCWFQFSSLQVTNMCLCRSVNEAKQQSDEGKLVESFWVFCWQRNVQFYIKRCDRRFSPSNSRKLMMWRCTHVNQSHDSAVHHSSWFIQEVSCTESHT